MSELLLTSFLTSNSPNRAMFLFVQMPFNAAKQSVLRACTDGVCWSGIKVRRLKFIADVAIFVILSTLFSILASLFLPALEIPIHTRSHATLHYKYISCPTLLDILLALA